MHEYEIRILSAGHPVTIIEEMHLSDHAAIRSARKYAADKPFEVWRGLECVFGTQTGVGTPKNGTTART